MKTKICSVDNCLSIVKHKGMCGKHYKRNWRHGNPQHCEVSNNKGCLCSISECNRRSAKIGLCKMHYQRFWKNNTTEASRNETGVGTVTANGYRLLTINGKRKYEHVLIAENALGETLPKGAVVHHIDNNPLNNNPNNLVICPNQAYHMLLHNRMNEND